MKNASTICKFQGCSEMMAFKDSSTLYDLSDAVIEPKRNNITELFKIAASRYPEKPAISYLNESLSYDELNKKSNQFARFLLSIGVKPNTFFPIVSDKSINVLIAILAMLKIGVSYVPINPDLSSNAIDSILEDMQAKFICIESGFGCGFVNESAFAIFLDKLDGYMAGLSNQDLSEEDEGCENAYAIYTSGSTGKPKGIIVTHLNLLHTYYSWEKVYELKSTDTHLQMASFFFDVFTGDWVRALCSGGKLVLVPKSFLLQPERLYNLIIKEKVNCAEFVPVVLKELLSFVQLKNLVIDQFRLLICGSDQWKMGDYRLTKQLFTPKCRVINSYGLTETTIDSTFFEEESITCFPDSAIVPIGKPFPHVKISLLGKGGKLIENDGEVGEICVGGYGVAKGYLGQNHIEGGFVRDPSMASENARVYKTGDFGEYLPDGNIAFWGRNEMHIKIDGKRVELLAIEAILSEHPKICHCIVSAVKQANHTMLQCFILFKDDVVFHRDLIKYLKERLPIYSIPRKFYALERLVLNGNGKISRNISLQKIKCEIKPDMVPPSNALEFQLVDIWKDTLNQAEIGVENDFYELNGTSLSYITMLKKTCTTFNVDIPCYMKFQTIKDLSAYILKIIPTRDYPTDMRRSNDC